MFPSIPPLVHWLVNRAQTPQTQEPSSTVSKRASASNRTAFGSGLPSTAPALEIPKRTSSLIKQDKDKQDSPKTPATKTPRHNAATFLKSRIDGNDAVSSEPNEYEQRYQNLDARNRKRIDDHHTKRSTARKAGQKLKEMVLPFSSDRPAALTVAQAESADSPDKKTVWGIEPAKNFAAAVYMAGKFKHPDNIDKNKLAEAVRHVLEKHPDLAVKALIEAFRIPQTYEEVVRDFGNGAGGYAHRWETILIDYLGQLTGIIATTVTGDVAGSLYVVRAVFAILQGYSAVTTGSRRLKTKDRENVGPFMMADPFKEIFAKALTPQQAKHTVRKLAETVPDLVDKLDKAVKNPNESALRTLEEQIQACEDQLTGVKAGRYNACVEYKGNRRAIGYRLISLVIRLIGTFGALGALGSAPKTGPAALLAAKLTLGITMLVSLIPHLIYHFRNDAEKDTQDKLKTVFENNARMLNHWINAGKYTPQEIADIDEKHFRGTITNAQREHALSDAFNMEAVSGMVKFSPEVLKCGAVKLLTGKLAKAMRNMVNAQNKAARFPYKLMSERYEKKVLHYREKAIPIFEDYYRLKKAEHYFEKAVTSADGKSPEYWLDMASAELEGIGDKHVQGMLLSKSSRKQGIALAMARELIKGETLNYKISYGASAFPEVITSIVNAGLASNNAALRFTGEPGGAIGRTYGGAQLVGGAINAGVSPEISGKRPNFQHAYGQDRAGFLEKVADKKNLGKEVIEVISPDEEYGAIKDAFRKALDDMLEKKTQSIPRQLNLQAGEGKLTIPLDSTQPYEDAIRDAMSFGEGVGLKKREARIVADLIWVGLRMLGPDETKALLKKTRGDRNEMMRLKPELRKAIREENFNLQLDVIGQPGFNDIAQRLKMDMAGFMQRLNRGVEEEFDTRISQSRPGMSSSAEEIAAWMDEVAKNENSLILRTGDGRFMMAKRADLGEEWRIVHKKGEDSVPLGQAIENENAIPVEIGCIPYTWRTDLPESLKTNFRMGKSEQEQPLSMLEEFDAGDVDLNRALAYFGLNNLWAFAEEEPAQSAQETQQQNEKKITPAAEAQHQSALQQPSERRKASGVPTSHGSVSALSRQLRDMLPKEASAQGAPVAQKTRSSSAARSNKGLAVSIDPKATSAIRLLDTHASSLMVLSDVADPKTELKRNEEFDRRRMGSGRAPRRFADEFDSTNNEPTEKYQAAMATHVAAARSRLAEIDLETGHASASGANCLIHSLLDQLQITGADNIRIAADIRRALVARLALVNVRLGQNEYLDSFGPHATHLIDIINERYPEANIAMRIYVPAPDGGLILSNEGNEGGTTDAPKQNSVAVMWVGGHYEPIKLAAA